MCLPTGHNSKYSPRPMHKPRMPSGVNGLCESSNPMETTMATLQGIQVELDRLAIAYPQANRSDHEMVALSRMWLEDLGHLTDAAIRDAIKEGRREWQWFPSSAQVLAVHERISRMTDEELAIPQFTTADIPANSERARKWIAKIKAKLDEVGRVPKRGNSEF